MDILLSWSGRASHEIASSLREWLRDVLPGAEPWVSSEDISKGKPWADELHAQLAKAKVTIICITPDNVRSPWLYYEAGFIAAKLGEAAVCPYLVGVPTKLVSDTPLGRYQVTQADRIDTLRLIQSLHALLGRPHDPRILEGNFKNAWPQLKRKIDRVSDTIEELVDTVTQTEAPLAQRLSVEAATMLKEACGSDSHSGTITYVRYLGGQSIQAGRKSLYQGHEPRALASWAGALDELINHSLVKALGYKNEVFEVTREGWAVYDQLRADGAPPSTS